MEINSVELPAYEYPPAWISPEEPYSFRKSSLMADNFEKLVFAKGNAHLLNGEKWLSKMEEEERELHPDYRKDVHNFLARTVMLRRSKVSDALGFNIRGGKEHSCGIFLSKVMPNTEAERLGLKEGDQILSVNGTDFLEVDHSKAVQVLKASAEIQMDVRYFPYGYRKTYEVPTSDTYGFSGQ